MGKGNWTWTLNTGRDPHSFPQDKHRVKLHQNAILHLSERCSQEEGALPQCWGRSTTETTVQQLESDNVVSLFFFLMTYWARFMPLMFSSIVCHYMGVWSRKFQQRRAAVDCNKTFTCKYNTVLGQITWAACLFWGSGISYNQWRGF